jgi:Flp pilus assembly protein TadG
MTTRTLTRFAKREDGQALVEFALVMPFLLLFIVGIVEFGRAWNEHEVLTDATREGARVAAVWNPSITLDSVKNAVKRVLASNNMTVADDSITAVGWDAKTGDNVTVRVAVPYDFIFFGQVAKWTTGQSHIVLKSSFTMRNE